MVLYILGFVLNFEISRVYDCSSGFYHDPNAGWYYSSRDALYYKFENGNYVLLNSQKVLFESVLDYVDGLFLRADGYRHWFSV